MNGFGGLFARTCKVPIVWLKETNAKDTDNLMRSQSRQSHLKAYSMSYIDIVFY